MDQNKPAVKHSNAAQLGQDHIFLGMSTWKLRIGRDRQPGERRIPVGMALAIAPLLGAAFAIYLPFIGIWCLGAALVEKVKSR